MLGDFQGTLCREKTAAAGDETLALVPGVMAQHVFFVTEFAFAPPPCDLLRFDDDVVLLFDVAGAGDFFFGQFAVIPESFEIGIGFRNGIGRIGPEANEDKPHMAVLFGLLAKMVKPIEAVGDAFPDVEAVRVLSRERGF